MPDNEKGRPGYDDEPKRPRPGGPDVETQDEPIAPPPGPGLGSGGGITDPGGGQGGGSGGGSGGGGGNP